MSTGEVCNESGLLEFRIKYVTKLAENKREIERERELLKIMAFCFKLWPVIFRTFVVDSSFRLDLIKFSKLNQAHTSTKPFIYTNFKYVNKTAKKKTTHTHTNFSTGNYSNHVSSVFSSGKCKILDDYFRSDILLWRNFIYIPNRGIIGLT